jgi:hypothetical protein
MRLLAFVQFCVDFGRLLPACCFNLSASFTRANRGSFVQIAGNVMELSVEFSLLIHHSWNGLELFVSIVAPYNNATVVNDYSQQIFYAVLLTSDVSR